MLSEKESGALRDILFQINAAERFTHDQTFESLRDDLMRLYAIIRSLEIISEASRRLSDELKARHPDIPWMARNGCSWQFLSPQLRRRDATPSLEDFARRIVAPAGGNRARAWQPSVTIVPDRAAKPCRVVLSSDLVSAGRLDTAPVSEATSRLRNRAPLDTESATSSPSRSAGFITASFISR
jgi:Protein of unknown function DUF86